MEAYVLLKMTSHKELSGYARTVLRKVREVSGVESADLLFGDFDAIVKLKAEKVHDIGNIVIEELSLIEGLENFSTLLCVDEKTLERED